MIQISRYSLSSARENIFRSEREREKKKRPLGRETVFLSLSLFLSLRSSCLINYSTLTLIASHGNQFHGRDKIFKPRKSGYLLPEKFSLIFFLVLFLLSLSWIIAFRILSACSLFSFLIISRDTYRWYEKARGMATLRAPARAAAARNYRSRTSGVKVGGTAEQKTWKRARMPMARAPSRLFSGAVRDAACDRSCGAIKTGPENSFARRKLREDPTVQTLQFPRKLFSSLIERGI